MAEPQDEQDESLGALFSRLVEDGKGVAKAEIGYYRAIALGKVAEARGGLAFGAAALLLAFATFIALVVGLILTLAPLVGPGFATLIVVAGALAFTALFGWLAYRQMQRVFGSGQ